MRYICNQLDNEVYLSIYIPFPSAFLALKYAQDDGINGLYDP